MTSKGNHTQTPEEWANEIIDPYSKVMSGRTHLSPEIVGLLKAHIAMAIRASLRATEVAVGG